MPDRIKFENVDDDDDSILFPDCCSSISASEDLGVESMADDQSVDFEFNFEEACQRWTKVLLNLNVNWLSLTVIGH